MGQQHSDRRTIPATPRHITVISCQGQEADQSAVCGVRGERLTPEPQWCFGRVVGRDNPRAPGPSRRLPCRQPRIRVRSPKRAFSRGSRRRCLDIPRQPGCEAAAPALSIRTCPCCPPTFAATPAGCRARPATSGNCIAGVELANLRVFRVGFPNLVGVNVPSISDSTRSPLVQTAFHLAEY
jgi:hypothetical protein